jgi:UDP-2,3-diacylglucosamine pyrophosphatase LpxH
MQPFSPPTAPCAVIRCGYLTCTSAACTARPSSCWIYSTASSAKRLYLVGDIVDVWAMTKRVHWPESHTRVLRKIMKISRGATEVIYIPGNHDANFREFCGSEFGNIRIRETGDP